MAKKINKKQNKNSNYKQQGNNQAKSQKNSKLALIIVASVVVLAVIIGGVYLIYDNYNNSTAAQYERAVEAIEDGNFKKGYDKLIEIAKTEKNYKDTNEILYTRALELIETGDLANKQAAYKMLEPIPEYKHAEAIMYYLWVEDVYDPEDDNSFEMARQFIDMIPTDYDGPFAQEVATFREQIKKSVEELNRKKYEAATSDELVLE